MTVVDPGAFRTDWAGRSLRSSARPIGAYAATVHARLRQASAASGKQPGDPRRAAEAIIAAVGSTEPPLNLVLDAPGPKAAREKIAALSAELDKWEALTLSADFPDAEQRGADAHPVSRLGAAPYPLAAHSGDE